MPAFHYKASHISKSYDSIKYLPLCFVHDKQDKDMAGFLLVTRWHVRKNIKQPCTFGSTRGGGGGEGSVGPIALSQYCFYGWLVNLASPAVQRGMSYSAGLFECILRYLSSHRRIINTLSGIPLYNRISVLKICKRCNTTTGMQTD